MSKVNVDEIKVGDLVEFTFEEDIALGYVVEVYDGGLRAFWSDSLSECNEDFEDEAITGHWKVINFDEQSESPYTEEESKVDELKVYTGKEAIEALLEGKTLESKPNKCLYKFEEGKFITTRPRGSGKWEQTVIGINTMLELEYTEVSTPQVGDWVRITTSHCNYVGKLSEVDGEWLRAKWNGNQEVYGVRLVDSKGDTWEILSPEQVSEYKREQAFVKVGRKLNEFRSGDIVCINVDGGVSIVVSNNNEESVRVHMLNVLGKGYTAKPHQLTPISFVEQQVDLS